MMGPIDLPADQPADCPTNHHVGRKMLPARYAADADCGCSSINHGLRQPPGILVGNNGGHSPRQRGVGRGKRRVSRTTAEELSLSIRESGTVPLENEFQPFIDDRSV